jgi:hypothetical protein
MSESVLYLKKMGLDFWEDEPVKSDINNYRVRTLGETIPGKDGKMYFLEFSLWRDRKQIRYTHKITGKPLKHATFDIINHCGMAIDTEFTDQYGSWRNCAIEKAINEKNYSYTQADILNAVNEISTNAYTNIVFV